MTRSPYPGDTAGGSFYQPGPLHRCDNCTFGASSLAKLIWHNQKAHGARVEGPK